ncbi:MAG: hypothetical protein JST61_07060 [Acidobacteria bacterium]|nr:hypothetical protein [Acidobacteriota bacterium]
MTKPEQSSSNDEAGTTGRQEQALAPEDFYYEGPYIVFTEAYHLKRGYCCNSNCRHCPYR